MRDRAFAAVLLAALLAGCSSVPLDDVPVEDKKPVATTGAPVAPPAQSQVTPVQADITSASQQGPQNVARIVYFDFDSYSIKPEYQSLIDAHARFLKQDPRRHVVIEGHTDERGGSEYNLALGQRRSEAVRKSLNLLGVADSQMEAVSFGKEKPAVEGSNEEAWAKNRRAEIAYRR
ncbi:MAG TPA: peptidoglycan-associated lipoprotein Pal [Ramlibacter sp.]|uniref:peptidoglycan-associated lipoprotein Pal n=1 Tax=Ramlibacter sp. TaxID=1917967 RepID=UPI002C563EAF|nr:peptidoglycan-associated lipoprotein Pal [Ramlibacter sp.]HVZ46569.1 peptidoglycan-associated lipoprotein Pal [Ramlibacter sp.]